jgi:hypothetical protein
MPFVYRERGLKAAGEADVDGLENEAGEECRFLNFLMACGIFFKLQKYKFKKG